VTNDLRPYEAGAGGGRSVALGNFLHV
jgi:hypothetical protein